MKTDWDYTELADAYIKRADYAPEALEKIFSISGVKPGDNACDIGAGVGHLTIPLAEYGLRIDAVEPNDAMRNNGIRRTNRFDNVAWHEGIGTDTGMQSGSYNLVTFGSCFDLCGPQEALKETYRLLKRNGYFACLYNHRDLEDPTQKSIENIIKDHIPDYQYGDRRKDKIAVINESGLFEEPVKIEEKIIWRQPINETMEAWRSHNTLKRQAGDKFSEIIQAIQNYLDNLGANEILVPYVTRVWIARRKD